jgi:hypothetical protein
MATSEQAAGVKLPKVQRRELHFLDAGQVEQLAATIDPRYRPWCGSPPTAACARASRSRLLRGTVRLPRFLRDELAAWLAGRLRAPVP